jgi:hypothetical protein
LADLAAYERGRSGWAERVVVYLLDLLHPESGLQALDRLQKTLDVALQAMRMA